MVHFGPNHVMPLVPQITIVTNLIIPTKLSTSFKVWPGLTCLKLPRIPRRKGAIIYEQMPPLLGPQRRRTAKEETNILKKPW